MKINVSYRYGTKLERKTVSMSKHSEVDLKKLTRLCSMCGYIRLIEKVLELREIVYPSFSSLGKNRPNGFNISNVTEYNVVA